MEGESEWVGVGRQARKRAGGKRTVERKEHINLHESLNKKPKP